MTDSISLLSPAKINLDLRILGRLPNGYHQLSTLMQTIDLADELVVSKNHADTFSCNITHLPTDERNLIIQARNLFREKTGYTQSLTILLQKNIPMEAGLGGGSGNAATMLWACNQLAGSPATLEELMEWGAELGSDVPFFFSLGRARCEGTGTDVHFVNEKEKRDLYVIKPECGLSAAAVYRELARLSASGMAPSIEESVYVNHLEKPAFSLNPNLKYLKAQLQACGFELVLMSGSGTCFFMWGEGSVQGLKDLSVFPCSFVYREKGSWY